MSLLNCPTTVTRIVDLARTLSPEDQRRLVLILKGESFEKTLAEEDARRTMHHGFSDEEIQSEIDAVRERHGQEERRAAGG